MKGTDNVKPLYMRDSRTFRFLFFERRIMPGKKGGNKGIAKAKKARKREEAEERNSRTPFERTRAYRRRLQGVPPSKEVIFEPLRRTTKAFKETTTKIHNMIKAFDRFEMSYRAGEMRDNPREMDNRLIDWIGERN